MICRALLILSLLAIPAYADPPQEPQQRQQQPTKPRRETNRLAGARLNLMESVPMRGEEARSIALLAIAESDDEALKNVLQAVLEPEKAQTEQLVEILSGLGEAIASRLGDPQTYAELAIVAFDARTAYERRIDEIEKAWFGALRAANPLATDQIDAAESRRLRDRFGRVKPFRMEATAPVEDIMTRLDVMSRVPDERRAQISPAIRTYMRERDAVNRQRVEMRIAYLLAMSTLSGGEEALFDANRVRILAINSHIEAEMVALNRQALIQICEGSDQDLAEEIRRIYSDLAAPAFARAAFGMSAALRSTSKECSNPNLPASLESLAASLELQLDPLLKEGRELVAAEEIDFSRMCAGGGSEWRVRENRQSEIAETILRAHLKTFRDVRALLEGEEELAKKVCSWLQYLTPAISGLPGGSKVLERYLVEIDELGRSKDPNPSKFH